MLKTKINIKIKFNYKLQLKNKDDVFAEYLIKAIKINFVDFIH